MKKDEFNQLPIEKQASYFNKLLRQGYSINMACKDVIGIAKSTLTDRFKAKGYVRIDNQYVKNKDVKHDNNITVNEIAYDSVADEENPQLVTNWTQAENGYTEELLIEMLDWYRKFRDVLVIDPKPINEGEGVTRSFKVDSKILNKFIQFCDENKQYSQKDLLSWALYQMMLNNPKK